MTENERRATPARVAAVVSAILLASGFVWYRVHRARAQDTMISSSKSGRVHLPTPATTTASTTGPTTSVAYPYPTTLPASGFKLSNSIGADFAVASDSKFGLVVKPGDLPPSLGGPTTRPLAAGSDRAVFVGTKSAAVFAPEDLRPATTPAASTTQPERLTTRPARD